MPGIGERQPPRLPIEDAVERGHESFVRQALQSAIHGAQDLGRRGDCFSSAKAIRAMIATMAAGRLCPLASAIRIPKWLSSGNEKS